MSKPRILLLDPDEIKVSKDRIREDIGDINDLCGSISRLGQLSPIAITEDFLLIAGMRRLSACKFLKRKVSAIIVSADDDLESLDMQIEENLRRKDFDLLEMGQALNRRKKIYEQIHPETKAGITGIRGNGDIATKESISGGNPAPRFTLATAKQFGISETKIKDLLQLASLSDEYKDKINEAKTTKDRCMVARSVLKEVRRQRKIDKLKDRINSDEQMNISEIGDQNREGKIKLMMKDNSDYFTEAVPGSFDLILTDPPYDTNRKSLISHIGRGDINTDFGKWDKLDIGWVLKASPLLIDGGQMLVFCPLEAVGEYRYVMESIGLIYRGAIIWHKTNPGTAYRATYLSSVEAIVWATRGDKYHYLPPKNCGSVEVHNFIEGPICGGDERLDHSAQKPIWLIRRLLDRHAHAGSNILDPFAGVGTTLVAAKERGMKATGIEIDAKFCGQAVLRLKATDEGR